ncbi:MAG: hypothetical protein ACR2PA_00560 [Hyphomicrobiaceae bacterium]
MTGHLLGDIVLFAVGLIVLMWIASALFGWIYFAWTILPTTGLGRRVAMLLRRDL